MTRKFKLAVLAGLLLFAGAIASNAQIKQVQMHIGGYLCGN